MLDAVGLSAVGGCFVVCRISPVDSSDVWVTLMGALRVGTSRADRAHQSVGVRKKPWLL